MSGFQPMEPNGRFALPQSAAPKLPGVVIQQQQQLQQQQQQQQPGTVENYSKLSTMTPSYLANANAADDNGLIRNPLFCLMCNQTYQNPCLLSCYHTFCAVCLKGRAKDGKLTCPLCGWVISIVPPVQRPSGLRRRHSSIFQIESLEPGFESA